MFKLSLRLDVSYNDFIYLFIASIYLFDLQLYYLLLFK